MIEQTKFGVLLVLFFGLFLFATSALSQNPTVGLLLNTPEAFNGYTLFIGGQKSTYLVNNCGELINKWESPFSAGSTAYLMPNGNLVRAIRIGSTNFQGGGIGGGVEIVDWQGNLVWNYEYYESASHHQHHDIEPLPNGNILILAWGYVDGPTAFINGRENDGDVWPTQIVEVEPLGIGEANIVWQWTVWDHIIQDIDSSRLNYGNVFEHPELVNANLGGGGFQGSLRGADWLHCNSIEYIEEHDLILLSSKYLNEVFIIDHSTSTEEAASHTGGNYGKGGDLLYRWGNPENYKRGNPSDRKIRGQHDAIWLPKTDSSAAQIMVVNNGNKGTVDAWTPPVTLDGNFFINQFQPFGPADFSWSHNAEIRSAVGCSARQMPNGNILYCDAQTGLIEEVTVDFEKVWQYQNPVNIIGPVDQGTDTNDGSFGGFGSFRAEKYAPNYLDTTLNLIAQGVVELLPYENTCSLFVAAAIDSMLTDSMLIDIIYEIDDFEIEIYPNPAKSWLTISSSYKHQFDWLTISSINGQAFIEQAFTPKVDVAGLKPGLYVLSLVGSQSSIVRKVMIN